MRHSSRPSRATAFAAAVMLAAPLFAQTPRLRPGQYEKQIELTMKGRGSRPPRKELQCVTADDIKDFSRNLGGRPKEQNCAVSDYKQTSSAVSYTQTCTTPDGSVTMNATITFPSDETFRAVVETSSTGGRASAASPLYQGSTITVTAKRIGDCAK